MEAPSKVANLMVEQFRMRCWMWGIRCGDITVEQGDMLNSPTLDKLLPKADVVLVDNKVFSESLNESLRSKFLDLKEGAVILSLNPFVKSVSSKNQITERNLDDMSSIFHSYAVSIQYAATTA